MNQKSIRLLILPDPVASVAMMRRLEQMMTTSRMRMMTAWVKFSAVRMTSVAPLGEPAPLAAAPMDDWWAAAETAATADTAAVTACDAAEEEEDAAAAAAAAAESATDDCHPSTDPREMSIF